MSFTHTTSPLLTACLILLVPFTIWDATYVFLRPHTLPGGKWHDPWFSANTYYASVDLMYSRKNWNSGDGFVAAHDVLHLIESSLAVIYLWIIFSKGAAIGGFKRRVTGKYAALAVIVGLMEGSMTLEMTLMCTFFEILGGPYSSIYTTYLPTYPGWRNLGHNSLSTIMGSWGLISALYYLLSIYQISFCAQDIFSYLSSAQSENHARKDI